VHWICTVSLLRHDIFSNLRYIALQSLLKKLIPIKQFLPWAKDCFTHQTLQSHWRPCIRLRKCAAVKHWFSPSSSAPANSEAWATAHLQILKRGWQCTCKFWSVGRRALANSEAWGPAHCKFWSVGYSALAKSEAGLEGTRKFWGVVATNLQSLSRGPQRTCKFSGVALSALAKCEAWTAVNLLSIAKHWRCEISKWLANCNETPCKASESWPIRIEQYKSIGLWRSWENIIKNDRNKSAATKLQRTCKVRSGLAAKYLLTWQKRKLFE